MCSFWTETLNYVFTFSYFWILSSKSFPRIAIGFGMTFMSCFFFFFSKKIYPMYTLVGFDPRPIASVSSSASGDDTTRPNRQGDINL
jgi:hypothetical protein